MSAEVDRLLDVDAAIQQVLDEAESLRRVAGGHVEASASLNQTRDSLVKIVESTRSLTEKAGSAIAVMREIGTPQIVEELRAARKAADASAASLTSGMAAVIAGQQETVTKLQSHASSVATAATAEVSNAVASDGGETRRALEAVARAQRVQLIAILIAAVGAITSAGLCAYVAFK